MNNYYLSSQLIADRQAAVAADLVHRAQLREARAARSAAVASATRRAWPSWTCRLLFGRLVPAAAQG